jgi:hypothetical protein
MHAFSRNFHLLTVKGSFTAFIIFTFLLFSLVDAQSEDERLLMDLSGETSAPSEETSAPNEEEPSTSNEASPAPSEETSASSEASSTPSEETSAPSSDETSFSSDETSDQSEDTPIPSASSNKDSMNPLVELPPESEYTNFAQKGSYENETWFSEVPQWHYYDMFGNKIIDGFYLYGLSKNGNDMGTGQSNLALHPFLRMWCSGLVQVADLHENGGIMAMIGDRVKSEFTPFSLKQTLFTGSRFDIFYKMASMTFLSNRISNTGAYGMVVNQSTATPTADWITGLHLNGKITEVAKIGGTWVNIHHEDSKSSDNPFSGVDSDTLTKKTPNGLSLYGIDIDLKLTKLKAYTEYLRSQEFLDGKFKPKAGTVATFNGYYDILDQLRLGGEGYTIGSRFQTNFNCPAHPYGDADGPLAEQTRVGKYQYSLVEDNDDKDEFPENGKSKYLNYTQKIAQGDPDGSIPESYDKDKNGKWDYEEDFLSYDADPPESKILFDRNNNGIPDEIEDDAYPDYPFVPSYYLPGEKYYRYDDMDTTWKMKMADSLVQKVHKGLAGYHLYTRFTILSNLELTIGGIFDRSQEKTFQPTYTNGVETGEVYDIEKASNIYFLAHYKGNIGRDANFAIDNFFRKVQDNIPNHTQGFYIDPGTEDVSYTTVVDELDYRDMFSDALRAEISIFKSRGFNYSGVGKFEFEKHTPHLEFNYPDLSLTKLTLINKCHYTILLPFFKDMFLIPKYKNIWEINNYSPRADSVDATYNAALTSNLDAKYRRNAMINSAHLVLEWKITEKTALTTGLQVKQFSDLLDGKESYVQPCFKIQLMMKDRYAGMVLVLTTGFAQYSYYYADNRLPHNPLNNPNRVVQNIDGHELFIKIHSGF